MIPDAPLVSIITPAYNAEGVISACLESSLEQTHSNWEHIVVNDGSTDGTGQAVADYLSDPRFVYRSLPANVGPGAAANEALRIARGRYVAVLDADDVALPRRLERQVSVLENSPVVVGVGSHLLEFGAWGGPQLSTWPTDPATIRRRQQRSLMPIAHPSAMLRTDVVRRVGGYDSRCLRCQDLALFIKLADCDFACLDEALVMYRTTRPVQFSYVLNELQYASLARSRNTVGSARSTPVRVNARSRVMTTMAAVVAWAARRRHETSSQSAACERSTPIQECLARDEGDE
ncbi:glycosyltransferase [Williamsia herbipolensis]|uniref:Glycosyltransferase n=1 Tax=Williamsia herbipolensis TaxID=1603258 RepID=A0AAU4K6S8_9NOCA|nr:glycosyltransferase family 2 protein [Williamsia herbipolensis]